LEIHNEFLELNYRYQYYLLELVADNGDYYLTTAKAMKILGLSKFKISQYVENINVDLATISPESHLAINGDGMFESKQINEAVVRKIRLAYLKDSTLFKLLEFSLMNPKQTETADFCDALFIGKTKFYELRKEMVEVTSQFGLEFSKNQIVGPENQIRQFIFEVYYSYFNGIEKPFEMLQETVDQIVTAIGQQYQIELLPTTDTKLEIFVKVQYLRMRGKASVDGRLLAVDFKETQPVVWQTMLTILTEHYQLLNVPLEAEAESLLTFLFAEGYLTLTTNYLDAGLQTQILEKSEQFLNQVRLGLERRPIQSAEFDEALDRLKGHLDQIHMRMLTFYVEPTTFIDENQLAYFAESNPLFHQIIQDFMNQQKTLAWRKQASLYYDYMFACIEDIPLRILKDRVYICVDFSQGKLYNQYMRKMVNYFNNLNIELQTTINEQTDLYLSDFYSSALTCEQLIWKNPPTVHNWQQFGDIVVALKKEKL